MMRKRTTIRDVATRAGVSPATVSNLLNGKERCGEDTRERIRAAMEELHFTPNGLIRALQNRRTHVLGLLIGGMELLWQPSPDPVTQPILAGIYQEADAALHDILLYTGWPNRPARSSGRDFLDGRVDGLIWLAPEPESPALKILADADLPVVALLSRRVPENVGYVDADNVAGMRQIVAHLTGQGHRRIAYVGPLHSSNFQDRYQGYRLALADAGIEPDPALSWVESSVRRGDPEEFARQFARWRELPAPPTAVVACTDNWAARMAEVITAAGLRIPADISLTGFDDMPLAATLRGGLTTARQPFQEAGRVAVRHLLRLIEGEEPARCRETLAAPLVTRATTAPVPTQIIIPTPDAKEPETS